MFPKKIIINILSAVFVIGIITFGVIHLNKPRIDISSEEKMAESTERLINSLNDKQKAKYDQAVRFIAFDGLTFNDLMSTEETIKRIKNKFKNKSYDDIIFDARKIVKVKITDLKNAKSTSAGIRTTLDQIVVQRTTITTDTSGLIPRRILYMLVKNNTGRNISSIAFNIKTFAPGREVPYLNDDFKYEIPGGIQAGETLEWNLEPNTFLNDEWNRDVPNGIIEIKAIAFTDPSGGTVEDPWNSEKDKLLQMYQEFMKD